jgi:hypothetical protein
MINKKVFPILIVSLIVIILAGCPAGGGSAGGGSGTGVVTLSWDAPTNNTDGSSLTDLAGYKIYYGPSSGNYTNSFNVGNSTSYTLNNLTTGTYYFAITAYNVAGYESTFSNEVSKTF